MRGTAEYRMHLVGVLVKRTLAEGGRAGHVRRNDLTSLTH